MKKKPTKRKKLLTADEIRARKNKLQNKWRKENPEKVAEYAEKYKQDYDLTTYNREYQKEWRKNNPEKVKAYRKAWRDKQKNKKNK